MKEPSFHFFVFNEDAGQAIGFRWVDFKTGKIRTFKTHLISDPVSAGFELQNMADALKQVILDNASGK